MGGPDQFHFEPREGRQFISRSGLTACRRGKQLRRSAAQATFASLSGNFIATVRNVSPPKRERTFESEFEKRHEARFKGVQFDWMDFHRDGGPFPVPNVRDPDVAPAQASAAALWQQSAVSSSPSRA